MSFNFGWGCATAHGIDVLPGDYEVHVRYVHPADGSNAEYTEVVSAP